MAEFAALESQQAAFMAAIRDHLALIAGDPPAPPRGYGARIDLRTLLAAYERSLILWALAKAHGQQLEASRLLCLRPTTLNEKMKRLGIARRVGPTP